MEIKDRLKELRANANLTQDELIGGQKERDKYNRYNILSIAYSSVCGVITLGLLIMMVLAIIERATLNDGWTGIGGFIVYIVFVLPVILGLVLFETVTLKKKNGHKELELYSLFAMILAWLISLPAYLYMV